MLERMLYFFGIALIIIVINVFIGPYLYNLDIIGTISTLEYSLILWSLNAAVTIGIAIILFFVGKRTAGLREISMMVILNALLDLYRIYEFPRLTFLSGVVTMFSAVFISGYAFVIYKRMAFKKYKGLYFLFLGPIYLFRFPFFIDLLLAYSTSGIVSRDRAIFYLDWNIYINYLIIFIEILVLDGFLREKQIIKHFKNDYA